MQVIIPNAVTPGSFTRASVANYWNSSGVLTSAAVDAIRIGYNPLDLTAPPYAILENAATNLLLNSAALSTQSVTTTNSAYTFTFYGTGSVTLSGTASATVVGVGVSPNRTMFVFTPTAGTLTLTVSGSVQNAQLEIGAIATSYITTTASAATRAADIATGGLVYSSVPEPDTTWPAWSSATAYVVGNMVSFNHRQYVCVINNTNRNPATDTATPPAWTDYGPTNRYAMFDTAVGTSTTSSTSSITVVLKTGQTTGVSFMQMNTGKIQIALADGSGAIYKRTIDMSSGATSTWLEYFTKPKNRITNYSLTDLPSSLSGVLTIIISSTDGVVSAGNVVVGPVFNFANKGSSSSVTAGATIGIIDYSVKTTDAFGNTSWTKRGYANRMNVKLMIDSTQLDIVANQLAAIRATPCVWVAATNIYQSLQVYGAYKDWEIELAYTTKSYATITIEGLV